MSGSKNGAGFLRHQMRKIIYWSSTTLFIGFSLGILAAHLAALQQPQCIEGKSQIVVSGPTGG